MLSEGQLPRPVISSACPAVVRLIRVRFPDLIRHILPLQAPVEVAARLAKKEAMERTGLPAEKIGCIFISPCAAKVTAVKMPLGTRKSAIDAVVAIRDVYPKMLSLMKEETDRTEEYLSSGRMGIGWGSSGGESARAPQRPVPGGGRHRKCHPRAGGSGGREAEFGGFCGA